MEDEVKKCGRCGLRTMGDFCSSCVAKTRELDDLAMAFVPQLYAEAVKSEYDVDGRGQPSRRVYRDDELVPPLTERAYELAKHFLAERDKRRKAGV